MASSKSPNIQWTLNTPSPGLVNLTRWPWCVNWAGTIIRPVGSYIGHYPWMDIDSVTVHQLSRIYTSCGRMRRQPAQMSTLAAACASPLHSASCAADKSINRRAYASVYVRICPYTEQCVGPRWPWSAFVLGWNACAGLRWPWKFNMFELWRRQSAYARVCAGRNGQQKYK